jgi:8-oxo-dGTP pyrophosphatase MutT (NUDIX family)
VAYCDEEGPAALARELREELDLDIRTLGDPPVLCWLQQQATTRPDSDVLFRRQHLIHVLEAPDHIRGLIAATEQDANDATKVIWIPLAEVAALHLYPDAARTLAAYSGPPHSIVELAPMQDHSYRWR